MDETTREELRRKMAEAAALPAHDPHRIGVAREVVDAGEWAEAEWLEGRIGAIAMPQDSTRVTRSSLWTRGQPSTRSQTSGFPVSPSRM